MTECVNTESVIGDSAISSPDSWVESEFGVMPEKFCESQSDSSLCDSGTAWDVYHATPVEVTNIDEGFVPSIEDRVPYEQSITKSYDDEGIYSLSSLERTQEQIQGLSEKKQAEVLKEKQVILENYNQDMTLEQSKAEITREEDAKQMNTSPLQKDKEPREQEPSYELCDAEVLANSGADDHLETDKTNQSHLSSNTEIPLPDQFADSVKQTSIGESTCREPECLKETVDFTGDAQDNEGQMNGRTESLNERNNSEEASVESQCQRTDSPLAEKRQDPVDEGVVETQESEGILRDYPDRQESISTTTVGALANTHPTDQEVAPSIPLISISCEPEEQNEEETCDPETQAHAEDEEAKQPEATGTNGTDTDVNSLQNPDEQSCDSNDNADENLDNRSLITENVKPTASEQIWDIENGHLDYTDEHDIRNSSNVDTYVPYTRDNMEISETKQECEFPHNNSQTDNTDKDLIAQTSSIDDTSQPLTTTEQDKMGDTFSDSETANTQQSTLDSVNSEPDGKIGVSCYEPPSASRDMNFFYADRSSPTEDLVGDPVEPMDLFYPDKEETIFTEPLDTEMQSWPSVLSVSALQPAPTSETLPDDQPLSSQDEDFRNRVDLIQENDKVNASLLNSASVQADHFNLKLASGLCKKLSISVYFQ